MRRAWLLAVLGLVGCQAAPTPRATPSTAPPPSEVAATARSGVVTFADVEQALRLEPATGAVEAPGDLSKRYRRAAETLVVRRSLLAGIDRLDAVLSRLGPEEADRIRRQSILQLYSAEHLHVARDVSESDISAYYRSHAALFNQPAERNVSYIFKRHHDPNAPQQTLATLAELRKQLLAGASFADVARANSDSETRAIGGNLGLVRPGKLPKPLERIVFALREGQISEPIVNREGGFLFKAARVKEAKHHPIDDVRASIRRTLMQKRVRDAVSALVADQPLPERAKVLDANGLNAALRLGADEVVLDLGGLVLRVAQLREALEEQQRNQPPDLEPDQALFRVYQGKVDEQRVYLKAQAEGYPESHTQQLTALQLRLALDRWSTRVVEERMWALVDAAPAELKRFFEENRFLYQSPLRLKLRSLIAPLGADPRPRMAALETLRQELMEAKLDLDAGAKRLGGQVLDMGWMSGDALRSLEPKVSYLVLDMNSTGYTIPFQLNDRLMLIQVEKRVEPLQKPFDDVAPQVRKDFFNRREQQLYRQVVDQILESEKFHFDEASVSRRLGPATKP